MPRKRRASTQKPDTLSDLPVALDLEPMEAALAHELPSGEGWQFEPKWDGFRCIAFRAGDEVELRAKSGKPLNRYFPDVVEALAGVRPGAFVLDGELVIEIDGAPSFEALQMRLHPAASRVAKLAAQTPARLAAFDALFTPKAGSLADAPLVERRAALDAFLDGLDCAAVLRSLYTRDASVAAEWLSRSGLATDGVVVKRLDGPYAPGERAMVKVKRLRTADCVIGGFRYATRGRVVGSLLLGLYDEEGALNQVGFVSGIPAAERAALTKRLEKLKGGAGFTGRAPGGPSRWSTERSAQWTPLEPELVAEVRFDHVTGQRLRHGAAFVRWRPDKAARQCRMEQIETTGARIWPEA